MSDADRPGVPPEIAARIKLIASLPDVDFDALVARLDGSEFFGTRAVLTAAVAEVLGDREVATEVVDVTLGFANASVAAGSQPMSRSVAASLAEDVSKGGLSLSADVLGERLFTLFTAPGVLLFAEARQLSRAHSRLWMRSSITPELRPVFQGEVGVHAVVPWHLLRVEYVDDLQHSESKFTEFALDHRDLLELRQEIDRALSRQRLMQGRLMSAGLPTWDPVESSGGSAEEGIFE